ncbi:MAG: hypothetical protein LC776_10595 [Acidobacteria bacterium]|nr:hypothetical protein [Acidobacteriota bacterium]
MLNELGGRITGDQDDRGCVGYNLIKLDHSRVPSALITDASAWLGGAWAPARPRSAGERQRSRAEGPARVVGVEEVGDVLRRPVHHLEAEQSVHEGGGCVLDEAFVAVALLHEPLDDGVHEEPLRRLCGW